MAAKKGKTKSAKVSGLKSKKLSAENAGQVKGGASPTISEGIWKSPAGHKDSVAWKLTGGLNTTLKGLGG